MRKKYSFSAVCASSLHGSLLNCRNANATQERETAAAPAEAAFATEQLHHPHSFSDQIQPSIIVIFFLFTAYSLDLSEQNPTHEIQESTTGQLLHVHYRCRVGFFFNFQESSVRTIFSSQITKILNIVPVKVDLDSWRLIVPSCVFTALSRVFPAMLCGFIISFSRAVWHLQEHTMQHFSGPSWCLLVQSRRQVLLGELRMKQKPSWYHPWPAGQGKTLRVFGKCESFHYAKDRMFRETFYCWKREVRIMKLACMWEYFTAKTKGVLFNNWMQRSNWGSVVLIFLSGGRNKVQISHEIIKKISETLSWLL